MRTVRGILMGRAYTLQVTVYDICIVQVSQPFNGVCELRDVQQ